MVNETNFIVRVSGKKENSYYIDYLGVYRLLELSNILDINPTVIKDKYLINGASYNEDMDVYYFSSIEKAKRTVTDILKDIKSDMRGRVVFLTDTEIEYVRKALINEGANSLHVKSSIKDAIFNKLNT